MRYEALDSICKVAAGGTPSRSKTEYWEDGSIPWIKIGNIKSKYVSEADEYITESGLNNSSAKLFAKGTILYTIFATLGEVGILDMAACTNQAIAGISIEKSKLMTTDYLYYYLKSKKAEVNQMGRGVAQNNINLSILRKFSIPVRDQNEQERIVETLNHIEAVIENKKTELANLDNLIKARFVEMFGDRFLNTMNWPTKKLGDCATFRNGKAHEKVISETGQYVLITSRAIASDLQDVRHTDSLLTPLATGDIVMVMSDVPNGKALAKCLLITENEKYTLNQRICSLSNYDLNPVFFTYLLNRHQFFLSFNDGNGQTNLRKDDILNCPLIRPSIELQNQFANFVAQIDKSKFVLSNELTMCNFYIRLIHDRVMHSCINLRVAQ